MNRTKRMPWIAALCACATLCCAQSQSGVASRGEADAQIADAQVADVERTDAAMGDRPRVDLTPPPDFARAREVVFVLTDCFAAQSTELRLNLDYTRRVVFDNGLVRLGGFVEGAGPRPSEFDVVARIPDGEATVALAAARFEATGALAVAQGTHPMDGSNEHARRCEAVEFHRAGAVYRWTLMNEGGLDEWPGVPAALVEAWRLAVTLAAQAR